MIKDNSERIPIYDEIWQVPIKGGTSLLVWDEDLARPQRTMEIILTVHWSFHWFEKKQNTAMHHIVIDVLFTKAKW